MGEVLLNILKRANGEKFYRTRVEGEGLAVYYELEIVVVGGALFNYLPA